MACMGLRGTGDVVSAQGCHSDSRLCWKQRAGGKAERFNTVRMQYGHGGPFPIGMAE